MLVSLKQSEIISALKQYIASQGINLTGKVVEVSFTAGRKESGISADITIDDTTEIPDFGYEAEETKSAQVLQLVASSEDAKDEDIGEEEQPITEDSATKTTSLFS